MSLPKEQPCPDCGEMVRVNSLRCWNCGAFMKRELEEKYLEMQSRPQQVIYSDLPQDEVTSMETGAPVMDESGEDDFELSVASPASSQATGTDKHETSSSTGIAESEKGAAANKSALSSGEATGDALLDIALQDERELQKQRRKRAQKGGIKTPGGGLIIFCPYGCRIVVKESHRGMQGKCPECRAPFIVPIDPPIYKKDRVATEVESSATEGGAVERWLSDLHLHTVHPEKLKLKADSLAKDFTATEFAFGSEQLFVVALGKKAGGRFGGGAKEDPREALKKQIQEGKKLEELEAAEKYAFTADELRMLKVVQPTASRADSIFHGIPVFGEGRIAIQLPPIEDKIEILYVSLGLTQFWNFKKFVEEAYGITGLGDECGIPTEHVFTTHRCQILETPVKALENLPFYKADETVELVPVGYQCGKCQIVVSEEGRARDSLGGKSPKGIAKAKCPKCSNKMGENLLYGIKVEEPEPAAVEA